MKQKILLTIAKLKPYILYPKFIIIIKKAVILQMSQFKTMIQSLINHFFQENSFIMNINYFNGIPIPNNIKVEKDKDKDDKIIISWNIDKIKIPDFDINKLKYQIELFHGEFNINTYEANKTSL